MAAFGDETIIGAELDVEIIQGKDLVAKDTRIFQANSSDPYVIVSLGAKEHTRTPIVYKSLAPTWNHKAKVNFIGRDLRDLQMNGHIVLAIFDYDTFSQDDPMGEIRVDLAQLAEGCVVTGWRDVKPCKDCTDATGKLEVKVSLLVRRSLYLKQSDAILLPTNKLMVGLGWEPLPPSGGGRPRPIDLDTSCVGVGRDGDVLMDETVYFADHRNTNGAITHSGDERSGEADLGGGDDERIYVDLKRVPQKVYALFFIGTVADEGRTFADVKAARMRIVNQENNTEMCRYVPGLLGPHTALFLARVSREGPDWKLVIIGETDHTARDFGTLVPEIRGYMSDLLPNITVTGKERVAIMRKGGNMRLADYGYETPSGPVQAPHALTFGLAWDVTNGVNIDLDASAILLDQNLSVVDLVFFGQLRSKDGSIQHSGDEREGDEEGDDEKIMLNLQAVHSSVMYIVFTINSYSGQELDDVSKTSCHLFHTRTGQDLAGYKLTDNKSLDKKTGLNMAMLSRTQAGGGDWNLRIISEAGRGRTVKDMIPMVQQHIRRQPVQEIAARSSFHKPHGVQVGEVISVRPQMGFAIPAASAPPAGLPVAVAVPVANPTAGYPAPSQALAMPAVALPVAQAVPVAQAEPRKAQPQPADIAPRFEGRWVYGMEGAEELFYEVRRSQPMELLYTEEGMTASIRLSQSGEGEGTLLQGGQSQGSIRLRFIQATGKIVSNFKAPGEADWGPDMLGARKLI